MNVVEKLNMKKIHTDIRSAVYLQDMNQEQFYTSISSHVREIRLKMRPSKNIAQIRWFVSNLDLEKLVHAFITSRVDYCNGLSCQKSLGY